MPDLALIRAWALTVAGLGAIIGGMIHEDAPLTILGFGALGFEPNIRAAVNGAVNGR
jgi:hypothetical protein